MSAPHQRAFSKGSTQTRTKICKGERQSTLLASEATWRTVTCSNLRAKKIDGPRSMLKNPPIPRAELADGNHACILVVECLADLSGHGFEVESMKDISGNISVSGSDESNSFWDSSEETFWEEVSGKQQFGSVQDIPKS